MDPRLPIAIEPQVNDLGRQSYALRYADGRIVHSGFASYEAAAKMRKTLRRRAAAQFVANNWTARLRHPRVTAYARTLGFQV